MQKFEELQEQIQHVIFRIDDADRLESILEYAKIRLDGLEAFKKYKALMEADHEVELAKAQKRGDA